MSPSPSDKGRNIIATRLSQECRQVSGTMRRRRPVSGIPYPSSYLAFSTCSVYKELRTLVASIENSSQIERNCKCLLFCTCIHLLCLVLLDSNLISLPCPSDETIVNIIHYFSLCAGGAIFLGIDFQQMLVSISALFIGIGFIIGGACANFLEVRRKSCASTGRRMTRILMTCR